jgi:hypothetical protein
MRKKLTSVVLLVALAVPFSGCASLKPPTSITTTQGRVSYTAEEIVVLLGTTMEAAIKLNQTSHCVPDQKCTPMLSDRNTRIVGNIFAPTIKVLDVAPNGWLPLARAAVEQTLLELDSEGREKLRPYLLAIEIALGMVGSLQGGA